MGNASSKLMMLNPVTFRYKPEYAHGDQTLQYGLIAEEVEKVYPDLVQYAADGKVLTVRYHLLNTMLLNEYQKQQRALQAQQQQMQQQQCLILSQTQQLKAQAQAMTNQAQQNAAQAQHLNDLELRLRRLEAQSPRRHQRRK